MNTLATQFASSLFAFCLSHGLAGRGDMATSPNLGFAVDSFEEAEEVIDAVLGQIDIPCPP